MTTEFIISENVLANRWPTDLRSRQNAKHGSTKIGADIFPKRAQKLHDYI